MIRNEIMNFISNSFSNLPQFPVINYDDEQRVESPLPRSNDDSNRLNPARDSLPHDICRSPTYIYQPTLRSSKTRMGPHHPRIQYSTKDRKSVV